MYEVDCIKPGLACAGVRKALARGTDGGRLDQLSQSTLKAIEQLTVCVEMPGDLLTELSITELWPRSRGKLSSGGNGV